MEPGKRPLKNTRTVTSAKSNKCLSNSWFHLSPEDDRIKSRTRLSIIDFEKCEMCCCRKSAGLHRLRGIAITTNDNSIPIANTRISRNTLQVDRNYSIPRNDKAHGEWRGARRLSETINECDTRLIFCNSGNNEIILFCINGHLLGHRRHGLSCVFFGSARSCYNALNSTLYNATDGLCQNRRGFFEHRNSHNSRSDGNHKGHEHREKYHLFVVQFMHCTSIQHTFCAI